MSTSGEQRAELLLEFPAPGRSARAGVRPFTGSAFIPTISMDVNERFRADVAAEFRARDGASDRACGRRVVAALPVGAGKDEVVGPLEEGVRPQIRPVFRDSDRSAELRLPPRFSERTTPNEGS